MGISGNKLQVTMLGEILIIQTFKRSGPDEDELAYHTLKKSVGRLVAYSESKQEIVVSLEGLPPIRADLKWDYLEIFKANFLDDGEASWT